MSEDDVHLKKFQKELSAGTVSLALLAVLARAGEPLYGYLIAKELERVGEGVLSGKQSALYPVLRNLEGAGLLESHVEPSSSGPPRRYYRINERGREVLAQNAATFAAVEQAYGVDRYIIAAIWGIESNYGAQGGDRSVLNSTATLACIGRRQDYFKDEFLAALEILHHGDLTPQQLRGSWAGAFGATQFMPSAFKRFAVDFDGDGKRNTVDDIPDIIASTAAKLKKDGWQAGQTWGYEAEVPRGFNYLYADRAKTYTIAQWEQFGIRRAGGKSFPRKTDKAFLLAPAGADGPGFLMLGNFRAIMRYNPSEAYALAIGHFADRLRGGAPFFGQWPRQERVLSRDERFELQQLLAQRGFYRGEADGTLGSETRKALRNFQAAAGLPADGFASSGVLDRLRGR